MDKTQESVRPAATGFARFFSRRWALWAVILAAGILLGFWTQGVYRERSLKRGEEFSIELATLVEGAREASGRNEFANAEVSLEKALALLRSSEQTRVHPAYLSVLVDLSSLRLSNANPSPETLAEVRGMLTEAWVLAEKAEPETRARIARERGLTELLDGKPAEARSWYQTAADILPEDEAARARIKMLGRISR